MNVNHKLLDTLQNLGNRGEPVERLYARMLDEKLFIAAYTKLYSNKGAMTDGIDPTDSIDGMSLARIREIIQTLQNNDWQWKPVRRTYIPKANGKQRPLGIPSWSDKLVQEVVRMVLEAYYEPVFHDESHGFRPNRSCHTALLQVKHTWTGVVWFVEGDIKGCFDNINHDILLDIVGKRICDFRFLKLIRSMLKAGYWENGTRHKTLSGTPQGGIVSPLLANIFLHELDEYIVNILKQAFDMGTRRRINPEYEKANNQYHYAKRRGNLQTARSWQQIRQTVSRSDPLDPTFRRLLYTRYADDFLIGIIGSRAEAQEVKDAVRSKLAELGLELSEEKTVITNAANEKARFLNYEIYKAQDLIHRSVNGRVQLSVPKDRVATIAKRYMKNGKPAHRNQLLWSEIPDIINTYDVELRGYYNYYKLAYNVSNRFGKLKSIMWFSLMRTLAGKLKTSIAKLRPRYRMTGPKSGNQCIGAWLETDKGRRLMTFGDFHLNVDKTPSYTDRDPYLAVLRERELSFRLKHHTCELCGTESQDLVVHHIRRMKDIRKKVEKGQAPRWQEIMASRNRKTLVICRKCHYQIHYG